MSLTHTAQFSQSCEYNPEIQEESNMNLTSMSALLVFHALLILIMACFLLQDR